MQKVLIYGNELPQLSYVQSPDGSIGFTVENDRKIDISHVDSVLKWEDLIDPDTAGLRCIDCVDVWDAQMALKANSTTAHNSLIKHFHFLADDFSSIIQSQSELAFFRGYIDLCIQASKYSDQDPWQYPALIPQVWVNWIHYDSRSHKRAQRVRKEPFRVDFLLLDEEIAPNFTVFEIDGLSHIGTYSTNAAGKTAVSASIDTYTEHVRKDRWLRKNGWHVYRITSQEIEEYPKDFSGTFDSTSFNDFFHEITGKYICPPLF